MVAAILAKSEEGIFSGRAGAGVLPPLAGLVPHLLRAPAIATVAGWPVQHDPGAEAALMMVSADDMQQLPYEERLAYLERKGYVDEDIGKAWSLVEAWLDGGVRIGLRRLATEEVELGSAFPVRFRDWLDGLDWDVLVRSVLDSGVPRPGLTLGFAVCEFEDDCRAARNQIAVRRQASGWHPGAGVAAFGDDVRLAEESLRSEADLWPVY